MMPAPITAIVLISCLGDFYGKVREVLAQPYIDRIEKAGPVPLIETRTVEEARQIIAKRLGASGGDVGTADASQYFGPQFFEEFGGLSTRRILELAQMRAREVEGEASPRVAESSGGFISTLAAALGFADARDDTEAEPEVAAAFNITSIPTLMIVRDGIVLYAQPGALPESALTELITKATELDMDEVRAQIENAPAKA